VYAISTKTTPITCAGVTTYAWLIRSSGALLCFGSRAWTNFEPCVNEQSNIEGHNLVHILLSRIHCLQSLRFHSHVAFSMRVSRSSNEKRFSVSCRLGLMTGEREDEPKSQSTSGAYDWHYEMESINFRQGMAFLERRPDANLRAARSHNLVVHSRCGQIANDYHRIRSITTMKVDRVRDSAPLQDVFTSRADSTLIRLKSRHCN
jgi:hypothetical protein